MYLERFILSINLYISTSRDREITAMPFNWYYFNYFSSSLPIHQSGNWRITHFLALIVTSDTIMIIHNKDCLRNRGCGFPTTSSIHPYRGFGFSRNDCTDRFTHILYFPPRSTNADGVCRDVARRNSTVDVASTP